ncbi:MAG: GNAT family N-acetyltransferase [Colwellia sp.]
MQQTNGFLPWFDDYAKEALAKNERRLVVLSGSDAWALSLLTTIEAIASALSTRHKENAQVKPEDNLKTKKPVDGELSCLIYGDSAAFIANVQKKRFRDHLGCESDFIIFADSQFTIDAFAALSGTLRAGGLLFLVIPSLAEKTAGSLFFKRFISFVNSMASHRVITELPATLLHRHDDSFVQVNESATDTVATLPNYSHDCITLEQSHAVQAIEKVLSGHRKRPLVLTADRGRGKSSALAIACAQIMKAQQHSKFELVITAPDIQSLTIFYRQLQRSLANGDQQGVLQGDQEIYQQASQQGSRVIYGKASLSFVAIDSLIKQPVKCNLLMVDEAAAIPVYLLEQLLGYYHRMVFSSTVHGYEGAGRGFTLKFQQILARVCPQWTHLHINQPIRWRIGDPLEQLVFEACLLNAELPKLTLTPTRLPLTDISPRALSHKKQPIESLLFTVMTAKELVSDEALLGQIFAVLVTAHYQTKPSDLKLLLDNPQVQLTCLLSKSKTEVFAVALLMNEGGIFGVNNKDVIDIKKSKRRLRNHFLPQSLLSHSGFESAFDYQYLRIMRIAVHPQIQQQGIGSHFIKKIGLHAKAQGADFIGSSFGANHDLLAFWFKADFTPVRVGFTKDKASGEHSILVIKGLNHQTIKHQQMFNTNFYRSFDYLLLDEYKFIAPELTCLLLKHNLKANLLVMSPLDIANVRAYSNGERLFSSCVYSLYLWFKHELLTDKNHLNEDQDHIELALIARLIQKHDISSVCQQYGYTGKKMLNQEIKNYVRLRLEEIKD